VKISKAKLKKLIESYLYEQEEDDTAAEDEPAETKDEIDTDSEEPKEDIGVKWKEAGFQIEVDGTKKDISFYEDEQTGKINYLVDGEEIRDKTTTNFVTIGSLASLSDEPEVQKAGEVLAKLDVNLRNKDLTSIKKTVRQKMKTERSPLSIKDIRKAVQVRE